MKTIILTAVMGAAIAFTGAANAAQFITDPVVKDLAATGQIISPHGIWTGR